MEFSEKWLSNASSFDLLLSGHFFDAWLEGAEIMEMPDKAATTNNFPDARRDAERTIITCDPPSLECHLDGQPAD